MAKWGIGRTGTRERPSFMIWVDLKPVPKSRLSLTNKASGSGYCGWIFMARDSMRFVPIKIKCSGCKFRFWTVLHTNSRWCTHASCSASPAQPAALRFLWGLRVRGFRLGVKGCGLSVVNLRSGLGYTGFRVEDFSVWETSGFGCLSSWALATCDT